MSDPTTTELLASGLVFSECPRWHDGELYISDMHAGVVLAFKLDGSKRLVAEVEGTPGGLGFLPDGTLLVLSQNQRKVYRVDADGLSLHADLSSLVDSPLNDMWVDGDGVAFVGVMGFDVHAFLHPKEGQTQPEIKPGTIIALAPDGTAKVATTEPLLFPNGIAVKPNGNLVVAQSFGFALSEFSRDASGTLTPVDTWSLSFAPDGISVNADGDVWVADPAGQRAVLIDGSGEEKEALTLDQQCLSLALGGPDGTTLFLCTSPGTDAEMLREAKGSRVEYLSAAVAAV